MAVIWQIAYLIERVPQKQKRPNLATLGQYGVVNGILKRQPIFQVHQYYLKCIYLYIYLFGVLRRFQHCTGHITMGSFVGGGNQYIQLVCQGFCTVNCIPMASNYQLSHLRSGREPNPRPQRWEAWVLLLSHHGPFSARLNHSRCPQLQNT